MSQWLHRERRELLTSERDQLTIAAYLAAVWVELNTGIFEYGRQDTRPAPVQRPDPGNQFQEVERLGQVVVGAQICRRRKIP